MKTEIATLVAYATITIAAAATPNAAQAGSSDVAAGLFGGFVAGAIVGSVVAPRPYYGPPPVYVAPAPVYAGPECYWTRGRAMWDGYRWVRPAIQVCD